MSELGWNQLSPNGNTHGTVRRVTKTGLLVVARDGLKSEQSYHPSFWTLLPTASTPVAPDVSAFMREMGRKGGQIGGKRRLETMTPEARSRQASFAARVRWHGRQK